MKEFCESFEFYSRTRKLIRRSAGVDLALKANPPVNVADLACGHGLTGILYAMFEKDVECVWLVDVKKTQSLTNVFRVQLFIVLMPMISLQSLL